MDKRNKMILIKEIKIIERNELQQIVLIKIKLVPGITEVKEKKSRWRLSKHNLDTVQG